MLLSILIILFLGLLVPFFYTRYQMASAVIISLVIVGVTIYFFRFLEPVLQGESFSSSYSWIHTLDIHLSFYLDGLSLFFTLLITVIGLLVLLYSFQYMEHYQEKGRFFGYLLFFMASMLGVVLSSNLISLFIFWELTSFSSFLLIGFTNRNKDSRKAARQALLVTAGGGLALMSGFILLEIITHTGFDLTEILINPEMVVNNKLHSAALILIAIGAFSKSAQFPLHFWLPNAMAAPTPVSAYLHSATMVKAGVYLIFRLNPVFDEVVLWENLLSVVGALTMIWGAFKALQEDDLKRILAYTTISALGIFFMMTGLGSTESINGVIIYVLAHALYKGSLFLTAGNIDHQTGTRKISQLSNLIEKMPVTGTAAILSSASMAGIIPFLGFVGKESLYKSLYHSQHPFALFYLGLLFLASVFFTAVTIDIMYNAFFKDGSLKSKKVREAGILMAMAPAALALIGLVTGLAPGSLVEPLLQWSASSITDSPPSMELKLWHGFTKIFLLSALTWGFGVVIYLSRNALRSLTKPYWLSADFVYDKILVGIRTFSTYTTEIVQNGYIRNYIATLLTVFSLLVIVVLEKGNLIEFPTMELLFHEIQIYEVVIIALIIIATVFLFRAKSRLVVTATFGIIGYSIALGYTLFSAPDVAITQFLAETLTLILLILILHRLPAYTLHKPIPHQKYLPVAVLFGLVMTFVSFTILNAEKPTGLMTTILEKSVSEGKGQNAVNVILVDFRALDTLGEITVLVVTMIGITALLNLKRQKPNEK